VENRLTLREAALRIGLAPVTLRLQAAKGILKAEKVGRDWVVSEKELKRYADKHQRQPAD
jgi:hypothetical protein